ncbi:flagellar basal body rod protein FlgC [Citromicrobium bathyomarinum]|jgi:flagellar basal-body rod protein FlgC|uniref:Flagellar basal-body rod protein FlgC n=1 Tax=Alteriqipengyuania abyssalis TaxID=2860200 RepID=A0ABS7PJ72_9SPHN|nr:MULTISPECIES: flagellar basal body rod protein FlgC [Sphingomonadales]MBY8337882.1 flagellar basal body rod protein FlgC [Alteriqipengyuania abyssalis]MCD1623214.1 flagellar basal body rod protein FlgC [Citromicrobium bathyomarinum]
MSLDSSIGVSAAGLRAQTLRMRVIAENLANANSVADTPGGDPYRRKVPTFRAALDRTSGATTVEITGIQADQSDFTRVHQPGNPAADADGYVKMPNVNSLIESADMKSAQRSYEANLNAIEAARSLTMRTIDLLK